MSEMQLDRLEARIEKFIEYVQSEFTGLRSDVGVLKTDVGILKTDVTGLKAEVGGLREELGALRLEMRERFEATGDRLKRIEDYYGSLNFEVIALGREISKARNEIDELRGAIMRLESVSLDTQLRISQLREDMQQRFRVVNDRLASVEKQLVA